MDMAILKRQILIDAVIYEGSIPPTKLKHFISEANELGMKGVQNFFDSRLTVGDVTLYMGEDDIYIDFFFSNNGRPDAPDAAKAHLRQFTTLIDKGLI